MMKTLVRWHKVSSQPGIPDGMTHRFKSCQPDVLAGAETPLTTSDSREGSSRLSSGGTFSSLLPDDIDRDLHRRNRSPVLEPVGRVPILGPAHSRPIIRSDPVSMVSDRSLQDVHGARSAFVVVNRAEDASRLDGHHTHSKLAPLHALDLRAKVNRCKQLHRNTLRLRCHLFVAHRALLSVRPGLSKIGRPFRRARRSDRGDTRPSWIRSRVVEHAPRSFSRVAATSRPEVVVTQRVHPSRGGLEVTPAGGLAPEKHAESRVHRRSPPVRCPRRANEAASSGEQLHRTEWYWGPNGTGYRMVLAGSRHAAETRVSARCDKARFISRPPGPCIATGEPASIEGRAERPVGRRKRCRADAACSLPQARQVCSCSRSPWHGQLERCPPRRSSGRRSSSTRTSLSTGT